MSEKHSEELRLRLLQERDVARGLQVTTHTLRHWRRVGCGPPWVRLGARLVRYPFDGLREWVERQAEAR